MNSSELIQGQIEALMPSYLRAKEDAIKTGKAEEKIGSDSLNFYLN
jgi:hypothetical protein